MQQRYLAVVEPPGLVSRHQDDADHTTALAQHRHAQQRADAQVTIDLKHRGIVAHVADMAGLTAQHDAARHGLPAGRPGKGVAQRIGHRGIVAFECPHVQQRAVMFDHDHRRRIAQVSRVSGDQLEPRGF